MGEEIKIIVYQDDDDSVKNKDCKILEETEFGVKIVLYDIKNNISYGASFFLPWHRIFKIKDRREE